MHRLLAAALTSAVAAALAVGTGFGIVAALNATPEQPNVPLVQFHSSPDEIPGLRSALPSASPSPGGSSDASPSGSPDASPGDSPGGSPDDSPGGAEKSPDKPAGSGSADEPGGGASGSAEASPAPGE